MKSTPYDAPKFTLKNQNEQPVSLKDFAGQWLVLYFYPKDDTPGCTVEACSLRDARDDLAALGAAVVGVSKDDAASHEKFIAKHSINFTLLSDPSGDTIRAYRAESKGLLGSKGTKQKTFMINPEGKVVKVYEKVIPLGHGQQLIAELRAQIGDRGGYGGGTF